MKIKSFIYTALASVLLFASCDLNKPMEFDDATQAFIAFDNTEGSLDEAADGVPCELDLTLYCASVEGVAAEVDVVVTADSFPEASRAIEGTHYVVDRIELYSIEYDQTKENFGERINVQVVDGVEKIKFTKERRFASIYIKSIDNAEQGGDVKFDVVLTNVKGCNLGAKSRCTITVVDDEDPINMLVGSYKATATSMFDGSSETWDVKITRDEEDPNTLWINPVISLARNGVPSHNSVYATVDLNNNTLAMPLGQSLFGSPDATDYNIAVAGFDAQANPVLSGAIVANFDVTNGVSITWTEGIGAGNTVDNGWWWQAVDGITYVKQ